MRTPLLPALLLAAPLVACKDKPPEVEDLGSFETDAEGLTPDIPFTVGDDATSVFVGCDWNHQSGDLATAWQILKPNGDTYYANEFHEDAADRPMRVGTFERYVPMLMPVSP